MRMGAQMRVGGKMAFAAWAVAWAARLTGFTGWPKDVLLTLFLLGCANMLIASSLVIAWELRDRRGVGRSADQARLAGGSTRADAQTGKRLHETHDGKSCPVCDDWLRERGR
jgi:hypothetical protein